MLQKFTAFDLDEFVAGKSKSWTFWNCDPSEFPWSYAKDEYAYVIAGQFYVTYDGEIPCSMSLKLSPATVLQCRCNHACSHTQIAALSALIPSSSARSSRAASVDGFCSIIKARTTRSERLLTHSRPTCRRRACGDQCRRLCPLPAWRDPL